MAEIVIAERKVILRDKFKAGESLGVVAGWANMYPVGKLPFAEQVGPMLPVVTNWELPGDCRDLAAWAELDVFTEFIPLWAAIAKHLNDLYDARTTTAKNSDAPPISPGA